MTSIQKTMTFAPPCILIANYIFFKLFFDTFDFYHHRLTTGAATVGSSAWEGTVGSGPPWRMRGVVPSSRTGSMRTRSLGWPFWHVPQPCRSCASESPSTSSKGSTKWRNSSKSQFQTGSKKLDPKQWLHGWLQKMEESREITTRFLSRPFCFPQQAQKKRRTVAYEGKICIT